MKVNTFTDKDGRTLYEITGEQSSVQKELDKHFRAGGMILPGSGNGVTLGGHRRVIVYYPVDAKQRKEKKAA